MPLYGGASAGTYREYADRAAFDVTSVSVACWVKWLASSANQRVVARGALAAAGDWGLGVASSGNRFFAVRKSGTNTLAQLAGGPTVGEWQHWAGGYDETTGGLFLYINGVLVGTASIAAAALDAGNQNVRFFESPAGTTHGNCHAAHFGFWSVPLTADDIAALYAGANPATIRHDALVVCDQLDSRTSIDTAGMVAPTDAGNLVATPRDLPYRRGWLDPMPGPRNVRRRRRARATTATAPRRLVNGGLVNANGLVNGGLVQ